MPTDEDRVVTGRLLLGAAVRGRRKAARMQLAELAERAGITKTYLSEIERGTKLASLPTLAAIASAFGTTVSELLDGVYPWGTVTAPSELPTAPPDGRAGRTIRRSDSGA